MFYLRRAGVLVMVGIALIGCAAQPIAEPLAISISTTPTLSTAPPVPTATWFASPVPTAEVTPTPIGLSNGEREAIRSELLAMEAEDQRAIIEWSARSGNMFDEATAQLWTEIRTRNADRLRAIVKTYGWPGRRLVQAEGASAAWLIAQHADHDVAFQRWCLEHMLNAQRSGDVSRSEVAYLVDRVLINEGRPQLYGTQTIQAPDGTITFAPIEDEVNVDRRRASVGLDPLAEYLKELGG